MSNRIEMLRQKMHAEAAAKPVKKVTTPRVANPKSIPAKSRVIAPPQPESTVFKPEMTLMECIESFTPEQAANTKVVVGTIMMFIADELLRSPRSTMATMSDNMLANYVYICEQVWADKPDIKQVLSRAISIVDGIEFRTGSGGEGEAIARLHQLERALVERKLGAR